MYGITPNQRRNVESEECFLFVAEPVVRAIVLYALPKPSQHLPFRVVEEAAVTKILQCGRWINSILRGLLSFQAQYKKVLR